MRSLAADPDPARAGLDKHFGEQLALPGRGADAVATHDRAIGCRPDDFFALGRQRRLLLERFDLFDNQRTFDRHRAWGERLERSVTVARRPRMNDRTSERGQHIDVLVDLAGHDRHDRVDAFARKPAPVQVGRFGRMNATGLATIDRRFTDVRRVRQARSSAAAKGFGVSRRLPASCPIPGRLRSSGTAM
ncbi:MAG: hypothetical protein DYH14_02375 [Betaproteobacteria bacterium PRO3]|nr:hypothetical protein [Betaproteobacteria bacterium PRO3]